MSTIEVAGFLSGALCVWLYVRQHVWAWPVGLVNSAAWLVLFWQSRLFLDAGLQVVYLVLGVLGWWWWVRGGGPGERLAVSRTSRRHAVAIWVVCLPATAVLWWAMRRAGDAAPLPDAATAVASLAAQYMLTRKLLGTWWVWIAVDVAYTALYGWRGLYLTAALQPVFAALCVAGLRSWRADLAASTSAASSAAVRARRALVVGKFLPPHTGHSLLVETAQKAADEVVVVVCERPDDPWPGARRAAALAATHPGVEVRVVPDDVDESDPVARAEEISKAWARKLAYELHHDGAVPDLVVSSEEYGPRFARHLGARHLVCDPDRLRVPVSGTAVRRDPLAQWDFLPPAVREWFVVRLVVLGAESTGTTTLARALADRYGAPWVPEHGRAYSERRLAAGEGVDGSLTWTSAEFDHIARVQAADEDRAVSDVARRDLPAPGVRPLVVADTDPFATGVWHERYLGDRSASVEAFGQARPCDLVVLTRDDIPFEDDGTRDGEHLRGWMTQRFRERLAERGVPWVEVGGSVQDRLAAVVPLVDRLRSAPARVVAAADLDRAEVTA